MMMTIFGETWIINGRAKDVWKREVGFTIESLLQMSMEVVNMRNPLSQSISLASHDVVVVAIILASLVAMRTVAAIRLRRL
jgi:hypothetical protein